MPYVYIIYTRFSAFSIYDYLNLVCAPNPGKEGISYVARLRRAVAACCSPLALSTRFAGSSNVGQGCKNVYFCYEHKMSY